jgi:hypothetical protein
MYSLTLRSVTPQKTSCLPVVKINIDLNCFMSAPENWDKGLWWPSIVRLGVKRRRNEDRGAETGGARRVYSLPAGGAQKMFDFSTCECCILVHALLSC